jgi:hypothetical protein
VFLFLCNNLHNVFIFHQLLHFTWKTTARKDNIK